MFFGPYILDPFLLNETIYSGIWGSGFGMDWSGCQPLTILLFFSDLNNQKMDEAIQGKWGKKSDIEEDNCPFK
jgi:hypothetical protein